MKPVVIFRFSEAEGPGYFADFLDLQQVPWVLVRIDQNDPIPVSADDYAGICLMGGPMSVNDPLPWIKDMCNLVRDAFVKEVPMIGHCLGGQLMSKSLGGRVQKNPVKEIGWTRIHPQPNAIAAQWFGPLATENALTVFQWHGETFSIPMQAELIASNADCKHQIAAFGPHLAMQCHVEMTPAMIAAWCEHWVAEVGHLEAQPSIQTPAAIQAEMETALVRLRTVADVLYTRWLSQVYTQ